MKNFLNLLFVLPAYEPAWALGGVVRCMSNLCRGLAGLGHKVTVYSINVDGQGSSLNVPTGQEISHGGVLTYYFPSSFCSGSFFDSRALVRRLGDTVRQFDLVYASAIWQWLGISVSAICGRLQVPLIIGTHGSFAQSLHHIRWLRKNIYWHCFLKRSLLRATALHYTTQHEREESRAYLKNFPSFIVPNSLDSQHFRPSPAGRQYFREKFGIPLDLPLIITVGRAVPNKRVDLLIRALPLVPEMNLMVVGPEPGEITERWQNLAKKLGVSSRITWPGYLQGEDLVKAYSAADLFALISTVENFGMAVVEAMACGLPVLINPEVGVCGEVRNGEGVFVVEQIPEAIGSTLQYVGNNRHSWPSWQENCVKIAQSRFAQDKVAGLMAQAFQDVLTGACSPDCRWEGTRV